MAVEKKDVKEAGQSIYRSKVVWKLADSDKGKMVVIDVDSGNYEVDADETIALERLLALRPDARTWTEEFRGPHIFRMGWRGTYLNYSLDDDAASFISKLNSSPKND